MNEPFAADWYHMRPPAAKTKRECTLEVLLAMALPYIEREELATRTNLKNRDLINDIREQLG